jgi:hypothetical protein
MTEYKLLPKPKRDGRIDDDQYIRINGNYLAFSHQLSVALSLTEETWIQLYRSSDGFLCFRLEHSNGPDNYHLNCINGGTRRPYYTCFVKYTVCAYNIPPGSRYHITAVSDGYYKTDCPISLLKLKD